MEVDVTRRDSTLISEIYFLIAKFLDDGPCWGAAEVLKKELENNRILPHRLDWEGRSHQQTYEELERKYPHITTKHLLQICARIGPVLEKEIPPCVKGVISLLGAGKQSLLRSKEEMDRYLNGITKYSGMTGGRPCLDPPGYYPQHNLVRVLQGRENCAYLSRRQAIPTSFYKKLQMYRHTLGHLSAVYCVLFDRTGRYIITGADDLLIKVWNSNDGRLLATFRGASGEIMDIAVNFDNTLLAAGSLDRIIRVWCFQTMSPVAVLSGHSGMITSVNFCPISCNDINYLVSTSNDGSVAFWAHAKDGNNRTVFQTKPLQYHEKMRPGQAQMICASFSPGGAFMAAGSADHNVRVYSMLGDEGPKRILEEEAHLDTVDSIQWAHSGLKFISGSKDGTANVWHFEQQEWHRKKLVMTKKLPGEDSNTEDDNTKKIKVTMVCWDVSDDWVVTAVNDMTLKVWNAKTAELVKVLRSHKDEVFVLESHPIDSRIVLSAGHDGQLIVWDILNNEPIASFQNFIQGQGNGAIFDAKWSPDGTTLAATDSQGHLLIYGFASGAERLKIIPKELFFHTDYRPLIRDANNYVLDEQTQTAPHLMPPPFLVDVDGNPYPPTTQRLVPGRENCRGEQLVPNIAVGASGNQEVIEGVPAQQNDQEPRSNIDRLIEALAQRRNIEPGINDENAAAPVEPQPVRQVDSPRGTGHSRPARREGDVEGVRQSSGNWQRDNTTPWNKPILAKPLHPSIRDMQYKQALAMAEMEMDHWKKEMCRRPQIQPHDASKSNQALNAKNKKRNTRHNYRTRAAREEQEQEENEFDNENSGSSVTEVSESSNEDELPSESSSSESSSEYSDWMADHGVTLEPPKRSKRKPVPKAPVHTPSDSDRRRSQRSPKKKAPSIPVSETLLEVPENYRPAEWLSAVSPKKAPYYPQMGDEVVYFRQGHLKYLTVVKEKKIYNPGPHAAPWDKIELRAQEFVKVIGIKYEVRPPTLCSLKVIKLNEETEQYTGETFTIKYHDMPDVLDFLVLRQTFDTALNRNWTEGARFRSMIDDQWWLGTIDSVEPAEGAFPDSYFTCFKVKWDNGEYEKMSPWDLEPIDDQRLPDELGGGMLVLPEEMKEILYQPTKDEWPKGDREAACRRIIRGLDEVMTLAIAEPFNVPVDLNVYPTYAYSIEYPIDLTTIKARFENFFYRRITSAQFDVRYLATNAEKFNEPHSTIVKNARIITDLCLKIIKEVQEQDVTTIYHQILNAYASSDSDIDVENIDEPCSSNHIRPTRSATKRKQIIKHSAQDWQATCRQILDTLWHDKDAVPFREPVDRIEHPDYHEIISTPMDLTTIREDLFGGNYQSMQEFVKDVKLVFQNSRTYNTNKRSKIYSMTLNLSSKFEDLLKSYSSRGSGKRRRTRRPVKQLNKNRNLKKAVPNGGPSTSRNKKIITDDDDDDDEDEEDEDDGKKIYDNNEDEDYDDEYFENTRLKTSSLRSSDVAGPSRLTNGHSRITTSSSQLSLRNRQTRMSSSDSSTSSESSSEDSDDLDESSDSNGVTKRATRSGKKGKATLTDGDSDESNEIYSPNIRAKKVLNNRSKSSRCKANGKFKRKIIKPLISDAEEEDQEEQQESGDQVVDEIIQQKRMEEYIQQNLIENDYDNALPESATAEPKEDDEDSLKLSKRKGKKFTSNTNVFDSDDSGNEDDEQEDKSDDDYEEEFNANKNSDSESDASVKQNFNGGPNLRSPKRQMRNCRIAKKTGNYHSPRTGIKRPRYRESSSDENLCEFNNATPSSNRRKIKKLQYSKDSNDSNGQMTNSPNSNENDENNARNILVSSKRRVRNKQPQYREESDDSLSRTSFNENDENNVRGISVSSRGRVRKMTEKALNSFR